MIVIQTRLHTFSFNRALINTLRFCFYKL